MGVRHKRIRDARYDELLDNFMRAIVRRWVYYFVCIWDWLNDLNLYCFVVEVATISFVNCRHNVTGFVLVNQNNNINLFGGFERSTIFWSHLNDFVCFI